MTKCNSKYLAVVTDPRIVHAYEITEFVIYKFSRTPIIHPSMVSSLLKHSDKEKVDKQVPEVLVDRNTLV